MVLCIIYVQGCLIVSPQTCISKRGAGGINILYKYFLRFVYSLSRKPESPKARSGQSASEVKDGTPKKLKQCNCKHSRCLKLYVLPRFMHNICRISHQYLWLIFDDTLN